MARAIRMTAAGDAIRAACCVGSVVLVAGATAATVTLYNGRPAEGGTIALQLAALANDSQTVYFGEDKGALFFDKGIYVEVGGGIVAAYIYIL